eukprot:c19687_g2_i1.p1 GENE.c19687_g2_i1~~c19687_g2_i1.p1  ORF type:complete len:458 (+),score=82.65 c19687_g2_i1:41-1414(+)
MVVVRRLQPQPLLDEACMREFIQMHGIKECHMMTLWSQLVRSNAQTPLDQIANLPQVMYDELPKDFSAMTTTLEDAVTSKDGTTTKLIIRLQDGHLIESVMMRHTQRTTLCVSSQVGCQMGCTFCATGTMGLLANLNAGEICEQVIHANRIEPVRNIVFMGMGEPLHNYSAVSSAVRALVEPRMFGLSPSHVTVSTVGVVPYMLRMSKDMPQVNMAVSLHAPTQPKRLQIVPTAHSYTIDALVNAMKTHQSTTGKKILIEYIMLGGVNDTHEDAHQLGALLKGMDVHVNLIPYNPTDATPCYRASTPDALAQFQKIVRDEHSLPTTIRVTMGQDVAGACGQLVKQKQLANDSNAQHKHGVTGDIEDTPVPQARPPTKTTANTGPKTSTRNRRGADESEPNHVTPDTKPATRSQTAVVAGQTIKHTNETRRECLLALGVFCLVFTVVYSAGLVLRGLL